MKTVLKKIRPEFIRELKAKTKQESLLELCSIADESPLVVDSKVLYRSMKERESIMSTGIGQGVAIPHVKSAALTDFLIVVGVSRHGIDFDSLDNQPVRCIVFIGAPESRDSEFLDIIGSLGRLFNREGILEEIVGASSPLDIQNMLFPLAPSK